MLERPSRACTVRASGESRRLPAAKLPTWKNLTGWYAISSLLSGLERRTTPRSRRRFSACGPERRCVLLAAQLALDESLIQIEEREPVRRDPPCEHVADERVERALRDRPTAQPGDDVVHAVRAAPRARDGCSGRRCRPRRRRTPSPRRSPVSRARARVRISSTGQGRKQPMPRAPMLDVARRGARRRRPESSREPNRERRRRCRRRPSGRGGRARRRGGRTTTSNSAAISGIRSSACICVACAR